MKVFEQPKYTTACGTPSEWEQLRKKFDGEVDVSVLDLRPADEASSDPLEKVPDNWLMRRLPIRGSTISEQDVDVFRREQRRHGRLIVVASNAARASLLCLTDLARLKRTLLPEDELKSLGEVDQEGELVEWLDEYLRRHQTTELGELER